MAEGTVGGFGDLAILVGNGATPEVFALFCAVTENGIQFSSETSTTQVPDCTDKSLPCFDHVTVKSQSIKIDCSGVWSAEDHGILQDWWWSGQPRNCKVRYENATSGDTKDISGPFLLTDLNDQASHGDTIKSSFNLVAASRPTLTAAV